MRERMLAAVPNLDVNTGIARIGVGMAALPFRTRRLAKLRVALIKRTLKFL